MRRGKVLHGKPRGWQNLLRLTFHRADAANHTLCLPCAVTRKGYKLGSRHKSIEGKAYFHMRADVALEKRLQRLPEYVPFIL